MKLRLFKPRSATLFQSFMSWFSGLPAEFSDPRFPSYGEGREGGLLKHEWASCQDAGGQLQHSPQGWGFTLGLHTLAVTPVCAQSRVWSPTE